MKRRGRTGHQPGHNNDQRCAFKIAPTCTKLHRLAPSASALPKLSCELGYQRRGGDGFAVRRGRQAIDCRPQAGIAQIRVRVNLGRLDAFVSEQFLHVADVYSASEQFGGASVPQAVRGRDAKQPDLLRSGPYGTLQRFLIDPPPHDLARVGMRTPSRRREHP